MLKIHFSDKQQHQSPEASRLRDGKTGPRSVISLTWLQPLSLVLRLHVGEINVWCYS